MSTINSQDQKLIEKLKKEVERTSGLASSEKWTQKDYDFLVYFIEEKSGVRISLSTLKRIWKNENNRLPHIATLDALSQVAFQKNWLSLKADLVSRQVPTTLKRPKQKRKWVWLTSIGLVVALLVVFGFNYFKVPKKNLAEMDNVHFLARTSVDGKVPNSVVFDYDISKIEAEKFYLQQNWDPRRRIEIFKENNQQTDIYFRPGLFFAKLIADTTILAQISVHIKSEDWFITSNQTVKGQSYAKENWLTDGTLGISIEKSASKNDSDNKRPNLLFYNVKDFMTDGDNFTYSSSFKMDTIEEVLCPKMSLIIKGEYDYFIIQIVEKGCESDAFLKLSEKQISGKTNDLMMLGTDIYKWQDIQVRSEDKILKLSLNGNEIYTHDYENAIGVIKEITHAFSGWGVIDNVELTDANDVVTFTDDFD